MVLKIKIQSGNGVGVRACGKKTEFQTGSVTISYASGDDDGKYIALPNSDNFDHKRVNMQANHDVIKVIPTKDLKLTLREKFLVSKYIH